MASSPEEPGTNELPSAAEIVEEETEEIVTGAGNKNGCRTTSDVSELTSQLLAEDYLDHPRNDDEGLLLQAHHRTSDHHTDGFETIAVRFRTVRPTDIPSCAVIERSSYPDDESASKSTLQYRQHHAAPYFRCAVVSGNETIDADQDDNDTVIGFICSTRCREFLHESLTTHVPNGPLLAIHSVVVQADYRSQGIATAMMKDYIQAVRDSNDDGTIEKIVLLSKKHLLAFYVNCGFEVKRPSSIRHGSEQWYDLELDLETCGRRPGISCYVVDSFADPEKPGTGNPAGIVVLENTKRNRVEITQQTTLQWMQMVAQEFNHSETAFIWPVLDTTANSTSNIDNEESASNAPSLLDKELVYHIRFFTPTTEVPLCGHATLAAAAVLYQTVQMKSRTETTLVFQAKEDRLTAELSASSGRSAKINLEFPSKPAIALAEEEDRAAVKSILEAALKVAPDNIVFMGLSDIGDLLIELTPEAFQKIGYEDLNYDAFLDWNGYRRGVIICCLAPEEEEDDYSRDGEEDDDDDGATNKTPQFHSRFFAPKAGIKEDPVTGSAHCVLAPYFCEKLETDRVIGKQASVRGGIVECTLIESTSGDGQKQGVRLTGTAVTTISGTLWL